MRRTRYFKLSHYVFRAFQEATVLKLGVSTSWLKHEFLTFLMIRTKKNFLLSRPLLKKLHFTELSWIDHRLFKYKNRYFLKLQSRIDRYVRRRTAKILSMSLQYDNYLRHEFHFAPATRTTNSGWLWVSVKGDEKNVENLALDGKPSNASVWMDADNYYSTVQYTSSIRLIVRENTFSIRLQHLENLFTYSRKFTLNFAFTTSILKDWFYVMEISFLRQIGKRKRKRDRESWHEETK